LEVEPAPLIMALEPNRKSRYGGSREVAHIERRGKVGVRPHERNGKRTKVIANGGDVTLQGTEGKKKLGYRSTRGRKKS